MKPSLRIGLVQFLGSNCDQDCIDAFKRHYNLELMCIWHTEVELPKLDGLILPGGFSYGDFLRSGSLASHTRIMTAVRKFAANGGAVLGICNGFQILTESQILPGALLKNSSGSFICNQVELGVAEGHSLYHNHLKSNDTLRIPIAHGEGRYFAPAETLKRLVDNGQVLFQYKSNPNGASLDIAGIVSENGRILGMMPHPERAVDKLLGGSSDGIAILNAFVETCSL